MAVVGTLTAAVGATVLGVASGWVALTLVGGLVASASVVYMLVEGWLEPPP